ncbi:MAG: molybdopterin cofactor-binding domain-containing protein [Pseudomonadota bacterium]
MGAAGRLRKRILLRTADLLMIENPDEMILLPGVILHVPSCREFPIEQIARLMNEAERIVVHRFRAPVSKALPTKDEKLRLHGIPHLIFSYGAHLALIEVDRLTGEVTVLKYLAISDCGRVINPQLVEQQMQGGIAQGLGYALHEDFKVKEGAILTPDLLTYVIPGAPDIPDMETTMLQIPEPSAPLGMKGAGEIAMDGPLPAVGNALADACGIRLSRSPFSAEQVLSALRRQRK